LSTLESSGAYGEQFKNARRLLTTESNKLENNIDPEWLEVDINKPIKVTKKILVPSFRYPKFNFVGKVIGPKGTTLQNIAKQFKCHVYILGRGSTRDRAKEQELLATNDPQYAHYGGPLHVKIETTAAPAVAYQRVAGVLQVLSELLIPVKDTHIEGITSEVPPGDGTNESGEKAEGGGAGGEGEYNAESGDNVKGFANKGYTPRAPFNSRGGGGGRGMGRPFVPRGMGHPGGFRPRGMGMRPGFRPY